MIKWVVLDLSGLVFNEGLKPACRRLATLFSQKEAEVSDYLLGEQSKRYRLGLQDPGGIL